MFAAAQGSAGEGVGLQYGRGTPTVVYDAPFMFLLGVLGAEIPGHLSPSPGTLGAAPAGGGRRPSTVTPLQAEVRVPWRPPTGKASASSCFTLPGPHFVKTAIGQRKQMDYF